MIGVIVPVYNAEKYLCQCIDSILAQTFADFELLLIDDGSKDNSGAICDEYAEKDKRIRVFHKENGGVSSARNMGLDKAKGEWITFVDADDYLYKDAFESLLKKSHADLIVGGYVHVGILSKKKKILLPDDRKIVIKGEGDILGEVMACYLTTPWCKLFRKNIIRDRNLRFDSSLSYGEDTDFVFQYVCWIDTIQFVSQAVYCYHDAEVDCICRDFDLLAQRAKVSYNKLQNRFLRDYSTLYIDGLLKIGSYSEFLKEVKEYKEAKCVLWADTYKKRVVVSMLRFCPPRLVYAFIRLYNG